MHNDRISILNVSTGNPSFVNIEPSAQGSPGVPIAGRSRWMFNLGFRNPPSWTIGKPAFIWPLPSTASAAAAHVH